MSTLLGLLLGVSVNFRLANLILSSGYVLFLLGTFLTSRKRVAFEEGLSFGIALLLGMAPTLLANAINAGSPLATTYGGQDVVPPAVSLDVIRQYSTDMQAGLLLLAGAWTIRLSLMHRGEGARRVGLLVAVNLLINLAFFMSHPIFTTYYMIPIAMLSLWTALFASLLRPAEAVDHSLRSRRQAPVRDIKRP
jgi:hypothetical protein